MQGMQQALMREIQRVDGKVGALTKKVDANEERAQQRHALVMVSLDNIDERLEQIEIGELPKIKQAVGMA
jgi:predicted  nucleic acid-binding Zn-ribbon protein